MPYIEDWTEQAGPYDKSRQKKKIYDDEHDEVYEGKYDEGGE